MTMIRSQTGTVVLGKEARLKAHLSVADDGECSRIAKRRLNEIMSDRNKIAHPTKDTVFLDVEDVQQVADFLKVLSQVLERRSGSRQAASW